ncbi:NUDIX hydrolase [Tindallia californiensis]|uniref:8-oxo-dGTP pyrophosphatase MutT, NUDIX family n=1 Tax=Tindallia californiensis TaxID=159292 RepID=A0A1H3JQU5_9FIRM|nr:CoA pyrophosphatase [Tindallia californiensis]SDY42293.1 8-oxo-dGTP pyrophosphatase MutT, NUDIX family [Tindallia californiensis]
MNYQQISNALAKSRARGYDHSAMFAVMLPLIHIDNKLHILFEVRSFDLESQPGEICFPGGKMEDGEHPSNTALRETMEELNISQNQIKIIGELPPYTTPFQFSIFPYCGVLQHVSFEDINYSTDEVHSIFTVPLSYFATQKPEEYTLTFEMKMDDQFPYHAIPNGKKYGWRTGTYKVLFYYYQHHVIWGMTAKMLHYFLESTKQHIDLSKI